MSFRERRLVAPPRVDAFAEGGASTRISSGEVRAMNALHFRMRGLMERFMPGGRVASEEHARTLQDTDFLARVRAGIERDYSDPHFTTSSAAQSLGISRMHLNRRLRALTGKSTHEYILEVRLAIARDLLLRTSSPVGSIASSVGFRSPSHFAEAFRKRFGIPPSHYRSLPPKPTDEVQAVDLGDGSRPQRRDRRG